MSKKEEITLPFKIKIIDNSYHVEVKDDNGKKWNGIGDTPNNAIRNLLNNIDIKNQKDEEAGVLKWIELNYNNALVTAIHLGNCLGNDSKLLEFTARGLSLKTGESIEDVCTRLELLSTFGLVKMLAGERDDPYSKWMFIWDDKIKKYELEQRLKQLDFDRRKIQKRIDTINNSLTKNVN